MRTLAVRQAFLRLMWIEVWEQRHTILLGKRQSFKNEIIPISLTTI